MFGVVRGVIFDGSAKGFGWKVLAGIWFFGLIGSVFGFEADRVVGRGCVYFIFRAFCDVEWYFGFGFSFFEGANVYFYFWGYVR